ncbi:unnamed protein product [Peronospora belbahrii]|uniref:SAYSvFN domain-containing protein n=1 Tax=Peronospora belbahrii TaxID=622444 RepID=A0AAU9KYW1_9STRA|nr:unnamed protein product [Peronospora belbahrii]
MANAPRVRRVQAVDQGPLEWLVPFIPPFLRVNCDTRAEICRKAANLLSKEAIESIVLALRPYWRSLVCYLLLTLVWTGLLVYIHHNEPEFAVAYVILSGFSALRYHLLNGVEGRVIDDMSAYSVFNRGAERMLGSLSAEQFENEIRHRHVGHEDASRQVWLVAQDLIDRDEDYDEDDPDLIVALKVSLQEKKREARRSRRTTCRK